MVINAVCFISGICLLASLQSLPTYPVLLVISLIAIALARKKPLLFVFLCGFVVAAVQARQILASALPPVFLNTEVLLEGRVTDLPEPQSGRLRFKVRLHSLRLPDTEQFYQANNELVRLNWYSTPPSLKPGDHLQLRVKLKAPNGFMNPGGFDYEKWLFQQRIAATGYVRNKDHRDIYLQQQSQGMLTPLWWAERARAWLHQRLIRATRSLPNQGLILALAVGDRSAINPQQWERFIATGTNHLLAISGLHITLVAGFAGFVAGLLWKYFVSLQKISRRNFALLMAAIAALVYAAMAGFSVPTQRALIMFSVLALLTVLRRHQTRQGALAIALIVVSLLNPLAVMSAGFWMSFAAVGILFLIYSFIPQTGFQYRLLNVARGHLLITLGLYPLTLLIFERASIIAPLANFFSVPLVGMVLTPLVFTGSVVAIFSVRAAEYIFMPVDWLFAMVDYLLSLMMLLPVATIHAGDLVIVLIAMIAIAAVLSLMPVSKSLRWLALVFVIPVFFPQSEAPAPGDYTVTFLDVGQGTAVVVRTHQHTMVYDTGPQYSATFNAADAVIIPYLRSQRIDTVDGLMVSHGDRDHSGGADELVKNFVVTTVAASAPLPNMSDVLPCRGGQQWLWDDVMFRVLYPSDRDTGSKNDLSCVLLVTTRGGKHTLLPGDVERAGEQKLLAIGLPSLELLMAPHHGSNTSSSKELLSTTTPKTVVYTTGFANRYRFPVPEVRQRYQAIGASEFNTATGGAITVAISDSHETYVTEYRQHSSGFWGRHLRSLSRTTATLY